MTTETTTGPELVVSKNQWGRSIHEYRYDGETYPSVTGILGVLKPWALVNAAVKEAVWYAVKQRKQFFAIAETSEEAAVEAFKGAHYKAWNAKRDHGINVHAMIAADVEPSEAERPYVEQYHHWLEDYKVDVLAQEYRVVHPEHGYGGTVDLCADVDGHITAVDLKVRDDLRVFPDRLAQVAAYCAAPVGHPMRPLHAAVLTLGADGYSYDEVTDVDAAVRAFVGLSKWHDWLGGQ